MTDDTPILVPDEVKSVKADERGRVNLGTDYAGENVRVAILGVEDDDD